MQGKIPSAITDITLDRATFHNVPVRGLTFVNFFYGNNGTGKSSIARAIEENDGLVWADSKSAADYDVLVYNQDFINDKVVKFGGLEGVFIFGEEDVEAKNKIAGLTALKTQKTGELNDARDAWREKNSAKAAALADFQDICFSKTAAIRKRFDKCMDGKKQKKGFADAVLGEKTPAEHDLSELERLYDAAYDDTARAYPEFRRAGSATTYGNLPGANLLNRVIVGSSETTFAKFMKKLGATASDWVRDGHARFAAAADGKCPYCQRKLPDGFEADMAATFDAQYQQDISDLSAFQSAYERETAEIVRILKANLRDVMPSVDAGSYREKLVLLERSFEVNRRRIAEKLKEPSKMVSLEDTDTLLLEMGSLIDYINTFVQANNDAVSEKRISKNRCRMDIMQHLAFLLSDEVRHYQEEVLRLEEEIRDITAKGQQLKKELADLTAKISVLNQHNANTEAAVDSINKILQDSGFQGFRLRTKKGEENVYEVIRQDETAAENLSEGERNFLAFLYFYHQVRGSMNDKECKDKIVVVDDPVSSMDSTAMFIVSAIIREMINITRNNTEYGNPKAQGNYIKQLFILTHNTRFHREVTAQQAGFYHCTSFYMIRKDNNLSTVSLCTRQRGEAPSEQENYNPVRDSYAALWDELRDIQSVIPALRVMRHILSCYFIRLCGYDGSDLREIVLEKQENREKFIRRAESGNPDMTDFRIASSLLAYIDYRDAPGDGPNDVPVCEDAGTYKKVFRLIFDVLGHNRHYKMMTEEWIKP